MEGKWGEGDISGTWVRGEQAVRTPTLRDGHGAGPARAAAASPLMPVAPNAPIAAAAQDIVYGQSDGASIRDPLSQ